MGRCPVSSNENRVFSYAERIGAFLFGPELSRFESRTYPSHFELPMAGRHVARRRGAAVRPSSARGREGRAGGRARRQAVCSGFLLKMYAPSCWGLIKVASGTSLRLGAQACAGRHAVSNSPVRKCCAPRCWGLSRVAAVPSGALVLRPTRGGILPSGEYFYGLISP